MRSSGGSGAEIGEQNSQTQHPPQAAPHPHPARQGSPACTGIQDTSPSVGPGDLPLSQASAMAPNLFGVTEPSETLSELRTLTWKLPRAPALTR